MHVVCTPPLLVSWLNRSSLGGSSSSQCFSIVRLCVTSFSCQSAARPVVRNKAASTPFSFLIFCSGVQPQLLIHDRRDSSSHWIQEFSTRLELQTGANVCALAPGWLGAARRLKGKPFLVIPKGCSSQQTCSLTGTCHREEAAARPMKAQAVPKIHCHTETENTDGKNMNYSIRSLDWDCVNNDDARRGGGI